MPIAACSFQVPTRGHTVVSKAGHGADPTRRERILVVDFDDTCTVGDTISHLVGSAMVPSVHGAGVVEEKERVYARLLRDYMTERNELVERLFSDDLRYQQQGWLEMFLDRLSHFETRRNDVVVASKILQGATMETISEAASKVVFREACVETLRRMMMSQGSRVAVLSANWSEEFIRASLEKEGLDARKLTVVANSLEFEVADFENDIEVESRVAIDSEGRSSLSSGVATGGMRVRRCQTPNDKDRLLKDLVMGQGGESSECLSVFVGDSVGDVRGLLGAGVENHVGIMMGRNALLGRVLERSGVDVRDLGEEGVFEEVGWRLAAEGGRPVFRTDSWEDVMRILGLHC